MGAHLICPKCQKDLGTAEENPRSFKCDGCGEPMYNPEAYAERVIECECGCWEAFPEDMPRHQSQQFKWLRNTLEEAWYECPDCTREVLSKTQ